MGLQCLLEGGDTRTVSDPRGSSIITITITTTTIMKSYKVLKDHLIIVIEW